jgi:hypothetical protein
MKADTPPTMPTSIGPSHGASPAGVRVVATLIPRGSVASRTRLLRLTMTVLSWLVPMDGPMASAGEVVAASKLTASTRLG